MKIRSTSPEVGARAKVIHSCALDQMGIGKLAGREGEIVEVVKSHHGEGGCWMSFQSPFMGEKEWFVPSSSICW